MQTYDRRHDERRTNTETYDGPEKRGGEDRRKGDRRKKPWDYLKGINARFPVDIRT